MMNLTMPAFVVWLLLNTTAGSNQLMKRVRWFARSLTGMAMLILAFAVGAYFLEVESSLIQILRKRTSCPCSCNFRPPGAGPTAIPPLACSIGTLS